MGLPSSGAPDDVGHADATPVVGLPGNPLSALVATVTLIQPSFEAWFGRAQRDLPKVAMAEGVAPSSRPLTRLMVGRRELGGFRQVERVSSAMLRGIATRMDGPSCRNKEFTRTRQCPGYPFPGCDTGETGRNATTAEVAIWSAALKFDESLNSSWNSRSRSIALRTLAVVSSRRWGHLSRYPRCCARRIARCWLVLFGSSSDSATSLTVIGPSRSTLMMRSRLDRLSPADSRMQLMNFTLSLDPCVSYVEGSCASRVDAEVDGPRISGRNPSR